MYTVVNPPPEDITIDLAIVAFVQATAGTFPFNAALSLPPPGSCTVILRSGDFLSQQYPNFSVTKALDAGPILTLSGTKGTRTVGLPAAHFNQLGKNLPGGALTNSVFLEPGAINFSIAGGGDVGAFKGSITNPPAITWTNRGQISTVNRSQPLTVNWTGAASGQIIEITGASTDQRTNSSARFTYVAPPGSTSFTVPSVILQSLPASRATRPAYQGTLTVGAIGASTPFAAMGLDFGIATISAFTGAPVTYQ
jgi:hypothetical protein